MQLIVNPQGLARGIYSEAIDLSLLGPLAIRRASHVEPDVHGRWWAELSPVDGPKLGPFNRRSDALSAEVEWLERHWLTRDMAIIRSQSTTPTGRDRSWD